MKRNAKVAVIVSILVVAAIPFVIRRLASDFESNLMRYKSAREADATVISKEWDASGAQGAGFGWVRFSIDDLQIENYRRNRDGQWQSTGTDERTRRNILAAEGRRGPRRWTVGKELYDSISPGDKIIVRYRLASDDGNIEMITIEGKRKSYPTKQGSEQDHVKHRHLAHDRF